MSPKVIATSIFIGCLLLHACSYLPEPENELGSIEIRETMDYIEMVPETDGSLSQTAFIFYPGGLVDPHAYEQLCSGFGLTGQGHRVIIVKMPANLAVLASGAARKIIKEFKEEKWVICGHSLGGAMACSMVDGERDFFDGLVLLAAYPGGSADLGDWDRPVLSITASEDKVVDQDKYEEARDRLPGDTEYWDIPGGNHAGFGHYGEQKGDGRASISREDQQREVVAQVELFLLTHGLE